MEKFCANFEWKEEQLHRRLHIAGNSSSDQYLKTIVTNLRKIMEKDIECNVWYLESSGECKTGIDEVDACEKQIICLIYLSDKISDVQHKMMLNEDYLEMYMLDELSNYMIFSASDQLNKYLTHRYKEKGLALTRKFFPGEKGIPLERQKPLLDHMKQQKPLDIDVNKAYMLVPEKAMLYVFGADKNNKEISWEHDCGTCEKKDCLFRKNGRENELPYSFCKSE